MRDGSGLRERPGEALGEEDTVSVTDSGVSDAEEGEEAFDKVPCEVGEK